MYYGKTTPELEKLNKEYQKMFEVPPFGHMEIEYGADEYEEYVRDIKKALKTAKTLVQLNDNRYHPFLGGSLRDFREYILRKIRSKH